MERNGLASMSRAQALVVFSLEHQRYALDLGKVRRAVRVVAITPLPQAPPIVVGIIDLGGEVIPVVSLRVRFRLPPKETRLSDHLVVAHTGRRAVALLVDETNGVIEVSPEDVAKADRIVPGLADIDGAVKLTDGLILIHDLGRLLSLDEEKAIGQALREGSPRT
jgi:purine-binding chemotaxis protein CheW